MEKSVLIIGKDGSGKTTKAREIASQLQDNEVVYLHYRGRKTIENPFLFSECTEKTKLVVFEELYDINQVKEFINIILGPITVSRPMKESFVISPKFIFVAQSEIDAEQLVQVGELVYGIFDIIECKN